MINTLICTVGTSLFESNLKNLSENTPNKPDNWKSIKKYYEETNWISLSQELIKVDPESRLCGAEINTVEEAIKKRWIDLKNLYFLVSDTDAGEQTGELLKLYFNKRTDLNLGEVDFVKVEDLQDTEPKKFKVHGLRNLVREVGKILKRFPNNIAIDATGGYKAQIAIAVLIGQALDIPVYYKHEKFSEIINFPPLPISLDFDFLGQHADLFTHLEKGNSLSNEEIGKVNEKMRVFLTEIEIDGNTLYELNPIGQIYLTSFRKRFPKAVNLKPASPGEKKKPSFRDDHYPIGFKEFVEKIWNEINWIKTCYSLPYIKQKSINEISFYVSEYENEFKLIGDYIDKNKFGARFRIILTDESKQSLNWAAKYLNERYS